MELHTEQAESYEACIRKIESQHGKAFRVLSQKEIISRGFLGFGRRQLVEITYRVVGSGYVNRYPAQTLSQSAPLARGGPQSLPSASFPAALPPSSGPAASSALAQAGDFELQKQRFLAEAKADMGLMVFKEVQSLRAALEKHGLGGESGPEEHETIVKIRELLSKNDFSSTYIRRVEQRLQSEFSLSALADFSEVQSRVLEWIGEDIKTTDEGPASVRPHILVLVGPTGVGKTTTIAKLAARFNIGSAVRRSLSVRMVTIDTYRIGAKDQLNTYGDIMKVPVSTIDTADDLRKILAMYQDSVDVILIDTIGKSPRDYTKLGEMKAILSPVSTNADFHLAVSATTKYSDLLEIFRQFEPFGYHSVIVTKLDETMRVGNLVSVLHEKGKRLSYIADGQKVPTNLEPASVLRLLTNLEGFTVDRRRLEARFPTDAAQANE